MEGRAVGVPPREWNGRGSRSGSSALGMEEPPPAPPLHSGPGLPRAGGGPRRQEEESRAGSGRALATNGGGERGRGRGGRGGTRRARGGSPHLLRTRPRASYPAAGGSPAREWNLAATGHFKVCESSVVGESDQRAQVRVIPEGGQGARGAEIGGKGQGPRALPGRRVAQTSCRIQHRQILFAESSVVLPTGSAGVGLVGQALDTHTGGALDTRGRTHKSDGVDS